MFNVRSRMSPRAPPGNILPLSYSTDPSGKSKAVHAARRRQMGLVLAVVLALAIAAAGAGLFSVLTVAYPTSASAAGSSPAGTAVDGQDPVDARSLQEVMEDEADVAGLEPVSPDDDGSQPIVVLSSGNGMWNTGVWPGWGMGSDVTLNWAAAGVRVQKTCPVKCRFSNNQALIPKATVVLMELVNHEKFLGRQQAEDTPIPWPARQEGTPFPYVGNFFFEPRNLYPKYTSSAEVMANVDFTIGPGHADIPVTLTCPWGASVDKYLQPAPLKSPGHSIAFFNEHGVAGEYKEWVEAFANEMGDDFHAFGQMANRPVPEEAGGNPFQLSKRIEFLGKYKFHLVTEFTVEDDWVEGELSQTFLAGSVPIYLGAPNVMDYAPGPHSLISVRDFSSPQDLAHYVRAMLEDEDRYNTYFDWKKGGLAPRFQQHLGNCVHYAECRICQFAHECRREHESKAAAQDSA